MDASLASHASFRTHRLRGKTALITGASKGIGQTVAELFAMHGASCILVARSESLLKQVCDSLAKPFGEEQEHLFFAADLADKKAADAVMDKVNAAGIIIDILIANAGYFPDAPLETCSLEMFDEIIQVNLTASTQFTRRVIPGMKAKKGGKIVYVTSINATVASLGLSAYCTAKAGLAAYMASAAVELAKYNILSNAVAPGYALTPGLMSWTPDGGPGSVAPDPDSMFPEWKQIIPLGRLAKPIEIAGPILWLASDENTFTTGHSLVVDGAQTRAENQTVLWPQGTP